MYVGEKMESLPSSRERSSQGHHRFYWISLKPAQVDGTQTYNLQSQGRPAEAPDWLSSFKKRRFCSKLSDSPDADPFMSDGIKKATAAEGSARWSPEHTEILHRLNTVTDFALGLLTPHGIL